jgi:hypothetical protein
MEVELQDPAPKDASIVKAFCTPNRRALIRIDLSTDTEAAQTEICRQPKTGKPRFYVSSRTGCYGCCERILTNCAFLRGTKGEAAI